MAHRASFYQDMSPAAVPRASLCTSRSRRNSNASVLSRNDSTQSISFSANQPRRNSNASVISCNDSMQSIPLSTNQSRRSSKCIASERGSATSRSFSTPALGGQECIRRRRDSLGQLPDTRLFHSVDSAAEETIVKAMEQPMCLSACMNSPSWQFFCFPAEYATRHRRKQDDIGDKVMESHDETDGIKSFGLPQLAHSGFTLLSPGEVHWDDELVPARLGLQIAIHRRTSLERLCYCCAKSRLPEWVGREQMHVLLKALARCGHVNTVYCHEAFEDDCNIYFMFESFPCRTLQSILGKHSWSQQEVASIARACCAAVAYMVSCGVNHMWLSLCHVLLPASCLDDDPFGAKIFGFGLFGVLISKSDDRACWAPEAIEKYNQVGHHFIARMENTAKARCDCWGLGVIVYTLIANRLPFLGDAQAIIEQILKRKWNFALAFDEFDCEARALVEGLMQSAPETRMKADVALRNEWLRRQCRPLMDSKDVLPKLKDFVDSPLTKRLFGRFLVQFLDSNHMRSIARSFCSVDLHGDGCLDLKELQAAAKSVGWSHSATLHVFKRLAPSDSTAISFLRFAECFAEDVIDGRAMRHAFESLDEDGSETITAHELYVALRGLEPTLTMGEVVAHIDQAELISAQGSQLCMDHVLDFSEFVCLFPVRVRRLESLRERFENTRAKADTVSADFQAVRQELERWITHLEGEIAVIARLSQKAADRNEGSDGAVKELSRHVEKVASDLKRPPGPKSSFIANSEDLRKKRRSSNNRRRSSKDRLDKVYGFGSFMLTQAEMGLWDTLIDPEMKQLRSCLAPKRLSKFDIDAPPHEIDHYKAHDAAESVMVKVGFILDWAKAQREEYESFVEVLVGIESPIPSLVYSGRGLQQHLGGDAEICENELRDLDQGEDHTNPLARLLQNVASQFSKR